MDLKSEIELLTYITADHLGINEDNIDVKQKTGKQVMARMIMCNILMECGIKPSQLAKHFCKHRTNYYHYLKLHKDYIQNERYNREYVDNFNAVFDEYKSKSERLDKIEELQALSEIDDTINDLLKIRKYLLQQQL
tara:strand:- start:887 stop:1294 length:408 start_codon:yes stop_codon:yes gene_type:complete